MFTMIALSAQNLNMKTCKTQLYFHLPKMLCLAHTLGIVILMLRHPSVRPSKSDRPSISRISETAWPIKVKCNVKPLLEG